MTKQVINIGSVANDGTGDPLRTAFTKANENFTEVYDTIPINIVIITSEDDFSVVLGKNVIQDNTYYQVGVSFLLITRPFDLSNITGLSTIDVKNNAISYTNSDTLFQGNMFGVFVLSNSLIFGNGSNTIWSLVGNGNSSSNLIVADKITMINFESRGVLDTIGAINHQNFQYSNCGTGLVIKSSNIVTMGTSPMSNSVSSNGPLISLSGTFGSVVLNNNPLIVLSGESFLHLSKDIVISGEFIINGNQYSNSNGGLFFENDISGNITSFSDNGSGGTTVTSTGHGLTIQQVAEILASGVYDSIHNITNITTNTFDIPVSFISNPATGNFDIGDSNLFLDNNNFDVKTNGDQIDSNEIVKYISTNTIPVTIPDSSSDGSNAVAVTGLSSDWSAVEERRYEVQFSGDPNGSCRYTGSKTLPFRISARMTVDAVGGSSKEMTGYITVNEVVQTQSKFTVDSSRVVTLNPEDLITLNPNDRVAVAIENNDDQTNINVIFVNINIIKA